MKSKLRLGVIGSAGVPGKYGGFETLAHQLVLHLAHKYDITVYCSSLAYGKNERRKTWHHAHLIYLPFRARGVQRVLYMMCSLLHALFYADVLLVLGVGGAMFFPLIKWLSTKRVIVNIDGLPWQRNDKILRRWYLKWSERVAVRWADEVIADNEKINDYVRQEYGREAQVVAYGGNHVVRREMMDADCTRYPFLSGRYGIKVCRIEPENNVELILSTFARYPKFPLVVVGNWEEKRYGRALRKRFEGYSHIHMLDPIYDSATLDILRGNAAFYLHGHSAGGTNPSLVEAMSLGLPVFAYDVGFNRETTQNAASYFRNQIQLMSLLEAAAPERLAKMGQRLHEIACTRYTWQAIVRGYEALIETGIEWAEVPEGSTYLSEVAIPAARQD